MSAVVAQPGPRFRVVGSRGGLTTWGLDPTEDQLAAGSRPGDEGSVGGRSTPTGLGVTLR